MVECWTRDREAAGSSLTSVTALCPWARHINPSLVLVQPRKTLPFITERLLMECKESNQTKSSLYCQWGAIGDYKVMLSSISNSFHETLFNPFPASHYFYHLLSYLLVHFGSLCCKQYGPRSDCCVHGAAWSGFILLASIIKNTSLECIWIYAVDVKSLQHFSYKKFGGMRVKSNLVLVGFFQNIVCYKFKVVLLGLQILGGNFMVKIYLVF